MSPGGHYQTNNVASRFAAAQRGHAPQPQAAADNSYDDFLAGERAHTAGGVSLINRVSRARNDGGWGSTGPCVCSWAGDDRSGCTGADDGSRCFKQCCGCDCAWTDHGANCDADDFDGTYCAGKCCPEAAAAAAAAARAPVATATGATAFNRARYGGVLGKTMTATAKTKAKSGAAFGPISGTLGSRAGWAMENGRGSIEGSGTFRVSGNARAYLVQDHAHSGGWDGHRYVRFDLSTSPLRFTLDLSNVPCGCLACVYLVAAADPSNGKSQYCDMAENVAPGAL